MKLLCSILTIIGGFNPWGREKTYVEPPRFDRLWWCPYAQTDAAKVQSRKLKVNTFYKHMVISECLHSYAHTHTHPFHLLYLYIHLYTYTQMITDVFVGVGRCGWVWVHMFFIYVFIYCMYVSHTSRLAFLIASCTVAWICLAWKPRHKNCKKKAGSVTIGPWNMPLPIGSMYAIYIYGNIYHQYYTPNVSIYTIHGSYGL